MRVAIVDDNAADRDWLAGQVEALLARRRLEGTVFPFPDGEDFLAADRRERFHLAFLDIYMDGRDGLSTAEELRSFDRDCQLVFSTTSPGHALDGYRVRAVQYLLKPYDSAALEGAFGQLALWLTANTALQRENQFLQMQTAQYAALRESIAETRRARHDMRHHFSALSALAQREAWDELRGYLSDVSASIPAKGLSLCENQAVDGVAGWYAALSRQSGVAFSCELALPAQLPVKEMDVCVVLQNLLENALEASRKVANGGYIRLKGSLHGDKLVLLTVENAYAGELIERDGVLQSTKPGGGGIGLESVARIAEKNDGYCRFLHGGGLFTANVMLR